MYAAGVSRVLEGGAEAVQQQESVTSEAAASRQYQLTVCDCGLNASQSTSH